MIIFRGFRHNDALVTAGNEPVADKTVSDGMRRLAVETACQRACDEWDEQPEGTVNHLVHEDDTGWIVRVEAVRQDKGRMDELAEDG